MASLEDLLAPDHFDWADEEEVLTTASLHDHHLRTHSPSSLFQQANQPETTIATAIQAGEELVSEKVESGAESRCTDSNSPAVVQTTTSTEMKEELSRSAYNTFGWRYYSVVIEPEIHHFNWLGNPVYQHSSTAPADSLAIILADPKVPEVRDDIRVQTLLRCAYTFLDPVVVILEGAQPHLLLRRGSQLQQAATGLAYKYYTPHGRWAIDSEEDPSEVAVDSGCIDAYITSILAVGNGFAQPVQIRSSTEWAQARATKLASLSKWSPPRKLEWKPRSSPLCQVMWAFDVQPRLRRKPGHRLLRVEEETMSPSSPVASPLPTPSPTPSSTPLSSPSPSPLLSPPPSPPSLSSPLSTPPAASSRPVSARSSASSKSPPTVPPPSVMDPSRDPNTYWSFPPPILAEGKPRRSLRRALKRGFKTLLSAVGIRKHSVVKVS